MPLPTALTGPKWTQRAARAVLPLVVKRAQQGRTVTYGELDAEAIKRGGHHVMVVQYGYPAGAIGSAMIELSERWDMHVPPLNTIIVNAADGMPGKGVDDYLKHYLLATNSKTKFTKKQRGAIVEEIQADVFAFKYWGQVLEEFGLKVKGGASISKKVPKKPPKLPKPGGWSNEPESPEHKRLKEHIAKHPAVVGLPSNTPHGTVEYTFRSKDKADVVFQKAKNLLAVEVKSHISNLADLAKGVFQAVKYQALLRAEQKARLEAPTATAVMVVEKPLPTNLAEVADLLAIEVFVVKVPAGKK